MRMMNGKGRLRYLSVIKMDEKKRGWGARLRASIKGKIKDEFAHRSRVKQTYNVAKRDEEVKFARERARRDVRSGGGSSRTAQRLLNAAQGGGSDRDYSGMGGGSHGVSSRVDMALGSSGSSGPRKSRKSTKKKSKSKPRKKAKSYANVVDDALGGF